MKIQKIGKRSTLVTHSLPGWDLNLHMIAGDRYHYLIDTGLGEDSVLPLMDLLENGRKPIIVINTHHHWDHIWGNHRFRDGIIVSHSLCRQMIAANWQEMWDNHHLFTQGVVSRCLPNLLFEDSLCFADDNIMLFHTPGHTADSISVYDAADRVLNVGDNIGDAVDDLLPSIRTNRATYLQSIHRYQKMDVECCISGHNIVLEKDVLWKIEALLSPNEA